MSTVPPGALVLIFNPETGTVFAKAATGEEESLATENWPEGHLDCATKAARTLLGVRPGEMARIERDFDYVFKRVVVPPGGELV